MFYISPQWVTPVTTPTHRAQLPYSFSCLNSPQNDASLILGSLSLQLASCTAERASHLCLAYALSYLADYSQFSSSQDDISGPTRSAPCLASIPSLVPFEDRWACLLYLQLAGSVTCVLCCVVCVCLCVCSASNSPHYVLYLTLFCHPAGLQMHSVFFHLNISNKIKLVCGLLGSTLFICSLLPTRCLKSCLILVSF